MRHPTIPCRGACGTMTRSARGLCPSCPMPARTEPRQVGRCGAWARKLPPSPVGFRSGVVVNLSGCNAALTDGSLTVTTARNVRLAPHAPHTPATGGTALDTVSGPHGANVATTLAVVLADWLPVVVVALAAVALGCAMLASGGVR